MLMSINTHICTNTTQLVDPLIHQEVLGLNPRRVIVTGAY